MTAPVRDLLPRTLNAFFGRFANFTSVQEQAIPALLGGRDALLCAPTASGKTEAYAAPLVERMLGAPRCPYRILFISPTRALANDLKRRLEERMAQLGVAFGRHTGEHKERVEGHPPEVAVMTPESLDSLLARRAAALAGVISVVLDEVHVLDGTPRGDHARLLLHRLDQCAAARPQRVAASATVDRPAEVAGRYLREALVVEAA
ncbi:MAG: DEAD/DEAH box helicase, partial [Planctomycetes bacterium]|nr:DEAD/DEAH box helicase [Planctomycetota bacterium]